MPTNDDDDDGGLVDDDDDDDDDNIGVETPTRSPQLRRRKTSYANRDCRLHRDGGDGKWEMMVLTTFRCDDNNMIIDLFMRRTKCNVNILFVKFS